MTCRLTFIIVIFIFSNGFCKAQEPGMDTLRNGKIYLKFPRTWHSLKETRDDITRLTITPDSLKGLAIKAFELFEINMSGRTFASFKEDFIYTIKSRTGGGETKILKTENIFFKGCETIYAEALEDGIPARIYGVNSGKKVYMITLLDRHHNGVLDLRMRQEADDILKDMVIYK